MHGVKKIATILVVTMLLSGCGGKQSQPQPQPMQAGKPPKQGQTQKVHLVWQPSGWMVKLNNNPPVKPDQAESRLDKDVGPTVFEVDIQGNTPARFKADSLSVWEGVGKKSSPQTGINSTQIIGPLVSADKKSLVFVDLNFGGPVTLNYELQLDNGPKVDPIIDNGGGEWQ